MDAADSLTPAPSGPGMRSLPHGYTNDTRGDGSVVVKSYVGPDADPRRERERTMLGRLAGRLPVPPLLADAASSEVRMGFLSGTHGQELVERGDAGRVLRSCGRLLRRVHDLDPAQILPEQALAPGTVVVHGDFGPNNVLLDPDTFVVTGVLDWEWAHAGRPVEDLAWCEWIIRMHHRDNLDALDGFFDAYGDRPAWSQRHDEMLARCASLLEMCRRWTPAAVRLWRERLDVTAGWTGEP